MSAQISPNTAAILDDRQNNSKTILDRINNNFTITSSVPILNRNGSLDYNFGNKLPNDNIRHADNPSYRTNTTLLPLLSDTSGDLSNNITRNNTQQLLETTINNAKTMNMSLDSVLANRTATMMSGYNISDPSPSWMPEMNNLVDVFSTCCSGAVILGGLVPYIPQYLKIKSSQSSDGFSTYVCLTLLLANILRIAFWFGHQFELPLLYQSFVMIGGMLAMMEICIRVRNKNVPFIIGVRPPKSRSRRSVIGKTLSESTNSANGRNGSHNESTPIYSMTSSSASSTSSSPISNTAALLPTLAGNSETNNNYAPPLRTPYHQQESIDIESQTDAYVVDLESSVHHNSNNLSSFSDLESPILHLQEPISSPREIVHQLPQAGNGTEFRLDHSYSNGFISNQRKHRSALVKWLCSQNFWDWDHLASYVKFLLLFTVTLSVITYLLLDNHLYIETLGFVAVFTESMLGMPQLIRNYAKKSTRGMSVEMVIMWLSGDLFKTLYFILRHAPVQFIVCGAIQVTVDVLILVQVFWYQRPKVTYSKLPKST